MTRFLRALATFSLAALLLLPLPRAEAQPVFSEDERTAIVEIMREYLLENPEIIREMITELERRETAEQDARRTQTLSEAHDALYGGDDIVMGNPDGDVTLVEFFDYNCGFCERALEHVDAMIAADPDLRVVLKDFPVLGQGSLDAARIGLAAMEQFDNETAGEFHIQLMRMRGQANGDNAARLAVELGADPDRLEADANSARVRDTLTENFELADDLGLTGTPAWVIGDAVISGAVGPERLGAAVANVRACGLAEC
ncbi:MAG: Protein-disulfide isomerase [Saliniramus fredricksonii]|uniref:Protein-disulfide isomerase n=1 Tax=Saliniramus fredricksonii TaxID=1653334 RepID=A0A0P7XBD5_9HYPH|nr:DsbA family protein [Saliniramus fredricksonii]KPQ12651.1 MAG: Protein-disulfide isomerase [Saliniramus fredricksonii]SCC82672.1 Protein-disulfide isomerase [Saliniramus fredricksonii]